MRLADLDGAEVAVWGLGVEGRAAQRVLPSLVPTARLVTVVDGETPLEPLERADVVLKSPGISLYRPEAQRAAARGALTSGTRLLLAERGGAGVVGVTGSKGKSTTTSLLHHLWRHLSGGDVALGGNIGRAPLELLTVQAPLALEVSSYQAADVDVSPEVGVLTALFPDHIPWHGSLERYVEDKLNLFRHGTRVVVADGSSAMVRAHAGLLPDVLWAPRWGLDPPLAGRHNARNLDLVLSTLDVLGLDPGGRRDEVAAALAGWAPLPHRLEPLGRLGGTGPDVVDDGMSSAPDAAAAAVDAFAGRPLVVVLGGVDRGLPVDVVAGALAARGSTPTWCVCLPDAGLRMADAVAAAAPAAIVIRAGCFDEAVAAAVEAVSSAGLGEEGVLLLSPGAPSQNEFASYRERSARFRSLLGLPPPRAELDPVV